MLQYSDNLQKLQLFKKFFSLSTLSFSTLLHNDPAAHHDYSRDAGFEPGTSGALPMSHHI